MTSLSFCFPIFFSSQKLFVTHAIFEKTKMTFFTVAKHTVTENVPTIVCFPKKFHVFVVLNASWPSRPNPEYRSIKNQRTEK